ncbi:MAG: isoprenylcysteine carboxylmethyltransferase family protein [Phycisphaerae bacterium]
MTAPRDEREGRPARLPRWGVGLPVSLLTLAWGGAAWAAHFLWYPTFAIEGTLRYVLAAWGGVLVLAGVPLYVWSLRVFRRAWRQGKLATTGPYARCRHPIYATWILLITPGVCLLIGSWLVLTTPLAMYAGTRLLVGREERAMEARFGEAWRAYHQRTGRFWPQ